MEDRDSVIFEEEIVHLGEIKREIESQLETVVQNLDQNKKTVMEQKRYLWENIYELDPEEIVSNEISISEEIDCYEFTDERRRLLEKLLNNPYFGRVDFVYEGETIAENLYIGLGGLRSKNTIETFIYDWRAPISSMYYDFDIGKASYIAPMGEVYGEIVQKRQLKIRKGNLEYAIKADIKIDDEILQKELSGNGSTKMRNIVATIQREQNSIVRDQSSNIMIVQGVAGSGKTSIALHRIAFLLYQNRKNLRSSEILIISPNNIFADYISNVLPELGEQNITEVCFDEIAEHELKKICKYENKYRQMEYIIECDDADDRLAQIRFKNTIVFLEELKAFVKRYQETQVTFNKYSFRGYEVSVAELNKMYRETFATYPLFERLDKIADRIADIFESNYNAVISRVVRDEIKQDLYQYAKTADLKDIYNEFLSDLKNRYSELKNCQYINNCALYEDVFSMILMKFLLFGRNKSQFDRMKHIIVDEMQDYSMTQYELLKVLFDCKMTILGDINQVVDSSNRTVLDDIQRIFNEKATLVKLMKSYRSTYEISEFCRKMCGLDEAESFERHGESPSLEKFDNYQQMIWEIQKKIESADMNKLTTMVVICKTSADAERLYYSLDKRFQEKSYLLNDDGKHFEEGIIITNSYLVKGLEFDYVIIPEVNKEKYKTDRDKQILYIAGTRALHKLDVLYYGEKSCFI